MFEGWWRVAPQLAGAGYTVVSPDLCGSSKLPSAADHSPYSKRAMAGDIVSWAGPLGHARFAVVDHDRVSYVATRIALDVPGAVTHLAVLDSMPIGEALARTDARFAAAWRHWFCFAQPERPGRPLHYRAGLGVDRAADNADQAAGRRIGCPTSVLWAADLHGGPIESGHHIAEDASEQLVADLTNLFR
ncbi:MAG: alpha/beta hydrolase [Actinomycetota bacterium]|nr:alpha/beta hydrolase [Actinomycetota bacterium]